MAKLIQAPRTEPYEPDKNQQNIDKIYQSEQQLFQRTSRRGIQHQQITTKMEKVEL